jgi:hypothetical protein
MCKGCSPDKHVETGSQAASIDREGFKCMWTHVISFIDRFYLLCFFIDDCLGKLGFIL